MATSVWIHNMSLGRRYTIAGGSASKVSRGQPRNPLFKILWDGKNPFSNKIVLMDEVHNLVSPAPHLLKNVHCRRSLDRLRTLLATATNCIGESQDWGSGTLALFVNTCPFISFGARGGLLPQSCIRNDVCDLARSVPPPPLFRDNSSVTLICARFLIITWDVCSVRYNGH